VLLAAHGTWTFCFVCLGRLENMAWCRCAFAAQSDREYSIWCFWGRRTSDLQDVKGISSGSGRGRSCHTLHESRRLPGTKLLFLRATFWLMLTIFRVLGECWGRFCTAIDVLTSCSILCNPILWRRLLYASHSLVDLASPLAAVNGNTLLTP